jgi:hypothetical protein
VRLAIELELGVEGQRQRMTSTYLLRNASFG